MSAIKAKTIDEQLNIVKSRLVSSNRDGEERFRKYLEKIGYDRLIYPYESIFYSTNPKSEKKFHKKISYKHIINIYKMDKEISNILLKTLLEIEESIKLEIKHYISNLLMNSKANNLQIINYDGLYEDKGDSVKFKRDVEIVKKLKIPKPSYNIMFFDKLTYFDVIDEITFSEVCNLLEVNQKTNPDLIDNVKKILGVSNLVDVKLIPTLRYIAKIRNKLAHNRTILMKGDQKNYVNRTDLYFWQSVGDLISYTSSGKSASKTNYYQFPDLYFFVKQYSSKVSSLLAADITSIYYKYAFSGDKMFVTQDEIFGMSIAQMVK